MKSMEVRCTWCRWIHQVGGQNQSLSTGTKLRACHQGGHDTPTDVQVHVQFGHVR